MIAETIRYVLSNLPLLLCIAAVLCAAVFDRETPWPQRYLSWTLLLAVGFDGVWAGVFHVFFPGTASAQLGWQASPFETKISIADISLGIVAMIAFWRSLAFQNAIALYAVLFYVGVSIGHFVQAFAHGDYSADNFGLLLILTILRAFALAGLLWAAWRAERDGYVR